ncbi:MAG TPA: hypothetical protein VGH83_01145 [Candidatus Acidoferrum sp.]|jgi:hypothetical protein
MTLDSLDRELDAPGHHDPGVEQLRRIDANPDGWVEENLELFESNCAKAERYKLPGQERWEGREKEEERTVRILHPSAVMRRLRTAGVDARNGEHANARLWLNDWTRAGLVGVNAWVAPEEMDEDGYLLELETASSQEKRDLITQNFYACREGRKVRRTLTSLQEPCGPEWSVMHFDDHGIATREKYRGWRTAMLVLIVAGLLTEAEVDRAFGPPLGEAGAWYREQLQCWRQIKMGRPI